MAIVAVNGGGNTPHGVQLEPCFVKSWSTSGDADSRPTERLAVDPTNPNVDFAPMDTPGADDKVSLSTMQADDGQVGEPVTFTFTVSPTSSDDAYVLTAIQHAGQPEACIPGTGDEVLIGFESGDGVQKGATTPGALLFHFSSEPNAAASDVQKGDWIADVTYHSDDAITFTAIAMAESGGHSDAHNPHGEDSFGLWQINAGPTQPNVNPDTFDCSGLVQWASGTAVATETLTIAHEGYWLI